MEIEQLRQEINELLENIMKHSNSYSEKEHLIALDVNVIQQKVNKLQESLTILKYLLEAKHQERGAGKKEIVVEEKQIEAVIEKEDEPVILAVQESVVEQQPTVEEESEAFVEEVVDKMETPKIENIEQLPIAKLADGLTLNDRYLYANELFNKDMTAFNDLVKAIDECSSLDAAVALYIAMDWELDNEHVVSFTNLVERRFS